MCTCYFEEKMWEGLEKRAEDKPSTGASSVSYRHNFLDL